MNDFPVPAYDNSILSIAASVLKYYGADTHGHATQPLFDEALKRNPRNVVVMLFDGMGVNLLEKHLPEDSFLRTHMRTTISSVFPPTTVAATTTIQSGLSPLEHGWLGWTLYFPKVNENVAAFSNRRTRDGKKASQHSLAMQDMPYVNLCDQVHQACPDVDAQTISFRAKHKNFSIGSSCRQVLRLTRQSGRHYIYCYWINPDHLIHKYGVNSDQVHATIIKINQQVEHMYAKLQDTTVVVLADHGLIDTKWMYLEDDPELMDMLVREPSIETRACSFFVRPECHPDFEKKFHEIFQEKFVLLSRQEVLDRHLFGTGTENKMIQQFVGDYLGIAISDTSLQVHHGSHELIGMHAGLTKEELQVPLILLEK